MAKIQPANGLRVEIFSRSLRENTTRPLTGWIGGTAENGARQIICFPAVFHVLGFV
jgi:hypothetical protein